MFTPQVYAHSGCQALTRESIDNGQYTNLANIMKLICHKIHRPTFVHHLS